MPSSKKPIQFNALQKSVGRNFRLLSQAPGTSWKKFRRSVSRSHQENVKDIHSLKQEQARNLRWQVQHLFTTYQATLWRRIALLMGAITVAALAGMALMYFRFTPARPLVTIGKHVIQRREFQEKLESAAGQSVLTKIVYSDLVRQAATKDGLMPTPSQVETRMDEMKRRGQQVPTGSSLPQFQEDLTLDMAMENLRIAGIIVTPAEIAQIYSRNKAQLTEPAQVQSILVVAPSSFGAQNAATLLSQGKTAAQVAAVPEMHVDGENNFHINLASLPLPLHKKIVQSALDMKPGQITSVPVGTGFLVIKCLHKTPTHLPSLPEIQEKLTRAVKLQKAPSTSVELAKLYKANKPSFDMDRYAAYFSSIDRAEVAAPAGAPKANAAP